MLSVINLVEIFDFSCWDLWKRQRQWKRQLKRQWQCDWNLFLQLLGSLATWWWSALSVTKTIFRWKSCWEQRWACRQWAWWRRRWGYRGWWQGWWRWRVWKPYAYKNDKKDDTEDDNGRDDNQDEDREDDEEDDNVGAGEHVQPVVGQHLLL